MPDVGDKLNIFWPQSGSDSCQKRVGKVVEVITSKNDKKPSNVKYKMYFKDTNETQIIKLSNMKWELRRKRVNKSDIQASIPSETESARKRPKIQTKELSTDSYQRILAPMVGASERFAYFAGNMVQP